jgi:23S rRNA (guanosine2251-2'-O)-methyltransferase
MREWISGRNPVFETLSSGRRQFFRLRIAQGVQETDRVQEILSLCRLHKLPVERVTRADLDAIASGNQGIALETSDYPYSTLLDILELATERLEPHLVLILDTLQDPQNLGTLLRTAEVTGVHGVVLPFRRTATVTPAVVHASSGASEHMLVVQANLAQAIASLKEAGVWVIGLESGAEALPPEQVRLDVPLALVVGSEAEGMRPLVRNSCDLLLHLPMRGRVASLNAAVAGSIALYLAWQARHFPGRIDR